MADVGDWTAADLPSAGLIGKKQEKQASDEGKAEVVYQL
jgi:hypothetical protein